MERREIRINQIVAHASAPEWRRRYQTFFINGDDETKRRYALPVLIPFSNNPHDPLYGVRVDHEGRVYNPRWLGADHINEGAIIFGSVQKGRDYAKNPPKTKQLRQLRFDYIPAGIDVALRLTETVRDK